jgi:hypothetical protein
VIEHPGLRGLKILPNDLAKEKENRPERLILFALGYAAVDGLEDQNRFQFPLPHFLRINPSTYAIMVKAQELSTQCL